MTTQTSDLIAITVLVLLLMATIFLASERGIEATSLQTKITSLETRLNKMRPVPKIEISRGTVYAGQGEIVVDTNKGL